MKYLKYDILVRIKRCAKGATAVEFALILPVFLLLLFGTLEFSFILYVKAVLNGASDVGARLGKTGYSASGISRQQTILNAIGQKTGGFLDTSKMTVTTLVYKKFSDIGGPEPYVDANHNGVYDNGESFTDVNGSGSWDSDMGKAGLGSAGDIVVYKIHYPWRVLTPLVGKIIADSSGNYSLDTAIVVRNEPY